MGNKAAKQSQATAAQARADEVARQDRIRAGTSSINDTFGQFDDEYFGGLRQSFVDYARPQLDDQMSDARKQLTFALARSGNLDSSTRGEQSADLQERYDLNLQDIADQGREYETTARNNVEQARGDLVAQLQLTGDNTGAANAALSRARALSTPPTYSPLGQLFQDSTAMLSQQAAFERAYAAGYGPKPRFNTGLFGTSNSAVRVGGR